MQLLAVLTVLVVAAVVIAGPLTLGKAQDSAHLATTRLVPASTAITTTATLYASGSAELVAAVQATDPQAASAAIPRLTADDTAANTAWKTYQNHSAHLPGEAKLQAQAAAATTQLSAAGVALLTSMSALPELGPFTALADKQQRALDALDQLYTTRINQVVANASQAFAAHQRAVLITSTIVLVAILVSFGLVIVSIRRRYRIELDERGRNVLESGLQRALEMARSEQDCYTLIQLAIEQTDPMIPSELLVADSDRAHFRQVLSTDAGDPGCPVMRPDDCPATSRGQTQTWSTSEALDACPHLRDRPSGPCAAVCIPVAIAGAAVGVVHAIGADHHPPGLSATADLELIARKSGERIGILRAFSRSQTEARTDPLTGLLNRRSLEAEVRDLAVDAHTYAVAYGDLDHFKLLNDVHGHDTGDRSLRLFARVLRDSVRPNDIVARYGGEEFVVVLPDCAITDAYSVIDRVRASLGAAQQGGAVPGFTVSFGLAPAAPDLAFGAVVEQADAALRQAKSEGRDRVVVAGTHDAAPDPVNPGASPARSLP